MRTLFLNGSPRLRNGNSEYFLKKVNNTGIVKYLYKDNFSDICKNLDKIDTIIISFPLYFDSPPNKVIEFMEYIEDNDINIESKNFYMICNCGFWEAKQNETATNIVKSFCINNKANYMGSFKIGAGVIIGQCDNKKVYKLVSIPFFIKIMNFKKAIDDKKKIELSTTIRPMTKKLYVYIANINWKKALIRNNCYEKK